MRWSCDPRASMIRGRAAGRAGRFLLAATALAAAGCERETPSRPASPETPDQIVRAFTLTETVNGLPRWKLTAESAATYRSQGVIRARGVAVDFYDSGGKQYSHLVAREGEIRTANNDMLARGHVLVTTTSGTQVETETLRYLNREQRIESEDRVTVRRGSDILSGIGFTSDPSLEHFEFHRAVRAQVTSPSGRMRVRERGGGP